MKSMFPIPRITESFIDRVIESIGWERYDAKNKPVQGLKNADYIAPNAILELKIFEEEGLEKKERQSKIAKLYDDLNYQSSVIDVSYEKAPFLIQRELKTIVSKPIQGAVKKASKQIAQTKSIINPKANGVLIAINNGYTYLNADSFKNIVKERCQNDSSNIDYVLCISVEHHQGDFDVYIMNYFKCYSINHNKEWEYEDVFQKAFDKMFNQSMTTMMQDLYNPNILNTSLPPVSDIQFERNGVSYIREAPLVPDSRFDKDLN